MGYNSIKKRISTKEEKEIMNYRYDWPKILAFNVGTNDKEWFGHVWRADGQLIIKKKSNCKKKKI